MPRTADTPNPAQMLEAARLFYVEDEAKQDIAERLRIDSRKVTALLKQARETGVVKITLSGIAAEQKLRTRYPHLQRVMIVPGPRITAKKYPELLRQFAVVGANYFDELVQNHPRGRELHIGITGGETLLEFAGAVPDRLRDNVFIHATSFVGHGKFGNSGTNVIPGVNAAVLWSRCGRILGNYEYATVPPPPFDLDQMAGIPAIREVLDDMRLIDVAFASMGMVKPPKSAPKLRGKLSMTQLLHQMVSTDELVHQGVVADFANCLVDKNGNGRPEWRYFLTAGYGTEYSDVEFYRRMVEQKKKVVVIGGPFKIPALMAGLRGKLFSIFITDQHSAAAILKES